MIDPFTVAAQIVNFLLLVWLLRRFLYGPVTRAMEAREARVRGEVDEARALRAEAEAAGERYRALVAGFETEQETRLAEVRAEMEALRHAQIREVRAEVKELRERWHRTLEQEKTEFLRELRALAGRELLTVMRHALRDLADEELEDRLVGRFLEQLRALEADDRELFAAAVREDGGALRLRTGFPASEAHRTLLVSALREALAVDVSPRFETEPDLVAGIELQAGGFKLAWTVDDYLRGLEEAVRGIFRETADIGEARDGS